MSASSDNRENERASGTPEEPEERTDGWMATYADMVTLLMTFFVLMFALSNIDNTKAEMFLLAMSRDGITAEQFMELNERLNLNDFNHDEWDDMLLAPHLDEEQTDGDDDEDESAGDRALRELAEALQRYIESEGLVNELSISFNGDFLMLTLSNDVWFDSGSAEISEPMRERAQVIAQLLADNFSDDAPFEIIVAGHTDNVPMMSAQFPTNWHLSNARATNFLFKLIEDSGLNSWHFYTRSSGEYRPIDSNDTPEGRQKNRRVEVMISLARENPIWDNALNMTG